MVDPDGLKVRVATPIQPGMSPYPHDLFGEIPVTLQEVEDWVWHHTGIPPDSWRYTRYVQCWDVVKKIQWAKKNPELGLIPG